MSLSKPIIIDDDDDDIIMLEPEEIAAFTRLSVSQPESDQAHCVGEAIYTNDSMSLPSGSIHQASVTAYGALHTPGMTIEYTEHRGEKDEEATQSLFHIRKLYKTPAGHIYIEGLPMRRLSELNGLMPKLDNELAICLELEDTRSTPPLEVTLKIIPFPKTSIIRDVHFTNVLSTSKAQGNCCDQHVHTMTETLVCRWIRWQKVRLGRVTTQEDALVRLRSGQCGATGVSDLDLRHCWRGTEATFTLRQRGPKRYTFGSICAGGGGDCRGASDAGLKVKFAMDNCKKACATLKANFPAAKVVCIDLYDFCTSPSGTRYHVDILHISFPCQGHSRANRTRTEDDVRNFLVYTLPLLLQKCKPRLVTIEQTSHIRSNDRQRWYHVYMKLFAECGYSCRSRVEQLQDFGNPSKRERFILVAACPGQSLPPMPEPTHGFGPGLKPYVTVKEAFKKLENFSGADASMTATQPRNETPWDPDQPFRLTITRGHGPWDVHYSGTRTTSLLEKASLQGFPPHHLWPGTEADTRNQTGNAVPPVAITPFFASFADWMRKEDEETEKAQRSARRR